MMKFHFENRPWSIFSVTKNHTIYYTNIQYHSVKNDIQRFITTIIIIYSLESKISLLIVLSKTPILLFNFESLYTLNID